MLLRAGEGWQQAVTGRTHLGAGKDPLAAALAFPARLPPTEGGEAQPGRAASPDTEHTARLQSVPFPTPVRSIAKGLLTAVLFTPHIMPTSPQKIKRPNKRLKILFKETEQTSERDSEMAGRLEG